MNAQIASATRVIQAPARDIYQIIADYRNGHPRILPRQYFLALEVEAGGLGAGTIVNFQMRLLGQTRSFRAQITEPEPGHLLVETDIQTQTRTSFRVTPVDDDSAAQVTITTELKSSNLLEGFIARRMLEKVYREELKLLADLVEEHGSRSRL